MRGLTLTAILVAWQTLCVAADPFTANVQPFQSVVSRMWVQRAVEGAAARLRKPECARVLADFSDIEGRALADKLKDLSPVDYLSNGMVFFDGTDQRSCESNDRLAFTHRGSHVVFICPAAFVATPHLREITIIHEMLHSLGLGENPPSSRDITRQVIARCGP